MKKLLAAALFLPGIAFGDGIKVEQPMVPLAPPNAMVHAAFMTLTNEGDAAAVLIGARADGYKMAHIHKSEEVDGIATMAAVDQLEIGPGQTVELKHGGLHIMLMHPTAPVGEGDMVPLTLVFADGSETPVEASVMKLQHGM